MPKKITRGGMAGWLVGKAICACVNLFYQNDTAERFLVALCWVVLDECKKRRIGSIGDSIWKGEG